MLLKSLPLLALLLTLISGIAVASPAAGDFEASDLSGAPAAIIDQYLQATHNQEAALRNASMEVQIDASVPKLKQQGRLQALRKISRVGQITYHVVAFQGANTVKKEVIARFMQADSQSQGDRNLSISPANYRFKYKGEKADAESDVYVFQLSPRKKRVGLFKGEIWLDARTFLPVYEKGRLVKNPSIFFKKVDFEREYAIRNGVPIPQRMTSIIDTRIVGKVELNVSYSNFSLNPAGETSIDHLPPVTASLLSN